MMKTNSCSKHTEPAVRLVQIIAVLLPLWAGAALGAVRNELNLDADWRFLLGDPVGASTFSWDDTGWRTLHVPHDWSIEGEYSAANPSGTFGAHLPAGIGWYRRVINVPESWQGRVVSVEFEGVYMDSQVWLNGVLVGGRPNGYVSFSCDLTGQLRPGRNVLAVRVDNSHEPSARWYHGCGIYGHVRLLVTDPVHIPAGGVFVQTPEVSPESARIRAGVELRNVTASNVEADVKLDVLDPTGRMLGGKVISASVSADSTRSIGLDMDVVHPALWSLDAPAIYALRTQVVLDGRVVDEVVTHFGIRRLEFRADTGLFLNGAPLKIQGVCEHLGGSPVGVAMPEALLERRLRQLKMMGCNAIRVAHHPQLPAFYDLCDRLGFLVMDEIFDGWQQKVPDDYAARFFQEWWRRDVIDWVRRDRNHPSVILWSIGNETGHDDVHGISALIRSLDATRPTTGGDVLSGVDVAGFNGRTVTSDEVLERFHRIHPNQPLLMSEEPHSFQTRGFYRTVNSVFNAIDRLPDYATPEVFEGGHSAYRSSYDNDGRRLVARNSWKRTVSRPWVLGEFRWTGFDYLGEAAWAGNESLAREFNFGVIDLAGFPKDHYYFYQSIWTERPMVHLLPHWTHPGLEGRMIPVVAYANADEVELFQDGRSLGRKPRSGLFDWVWHVPYSPGMLKAVAYRAGVAVADTVQRTAERSSRLELATDNSALKAERGDVAVVTMAVRDDYGTLVPDADCRIDLKLLGAARYLGAENGNPVDITPQHEPWRRAFAGLARAFYAGLDAQEGRIEVAALAVLGPTYYSDTATVSVAFERVALRGNLPVQPTVIRYTTDGSEPKSDSKIYSVPIQLEATATVRATVFVNDQPLLSTFGKFTRGAHPLTVHPALSREDKAAAEDPTQRSGKSPE